MLKKPKTCYCICKLWDLANRYYYQILTLLMVQVGEQLRLALLRRKLSTDHLAGRTGISRRTIYRIKKGSPSVSIGYYLNVFKVLGLEMDILNLAKDDKLGIGNNSSNSCPLIKLKDINLIRFYLKYQPVLFYIYFFS